MNLIVRKFDHAPEVYRKPLEARFNSPMLKNIPPLDGKKAIKDILQKMLFDSAQGKDIPDMVLTTMAKNLYNDIRSIFFNVTIQEIRVALESGIRGSYVAKTGNLFGGVTVVNCIHWIRAYLESETVIESIKHHMLPPKVETPVDKDVLRKGFTTIQQTLCEFINKEKQKKSTNYISEKLELTRDQKWIIMFDKIHFKQGFTTGDNGTGSRYIKRYGKNMTINDYLKHKEAQFVFVHEILKQRG